MDSERFQALFPKITDEQWDLLSQWSELMRDWNEKINLVSRKDIASDTSVIDKIEENVDEAPKVPDNNN